MTTGKIDAEQQGIGTALAQRRLKVPLNQRDYSWEAKHVRDLFDDLQDALSEGRDAYFLGTIVLTLGETKSPRPEVADGQQRLATITILLAAIRDYMLSIERTTTATALDTTFLRTLDYKTEEVQPHIYLNVNDNEFFARRVLAKPDEPARIGDTDNSPSLRESHRRINRAAVLAAEHVAGIVEHHGRSGIQRLTDWVDYIEHRAQVIVLSVPNYINAFMMFETLNDRGLKASQADLLKNHVLSLAGERIQEAQQKWATMQGILESTGADDIVVSYLRHVMITRHGTVKERELFEKVKQYVNSRSSAVAFADSLAYAASDYAALYNSDHSKWNAYGKETKRSVAILLELDVEQIRPLLFAVAHHFAPTEAQKAFRMFVAWSVRFLIWGGRGGLLDRNYSIRAQEVGTGAITTAAELADQMDKALPTDAEFRSAFVTARVSKGRLARYYLRALEEKKRAATEAPELLPNDDTDHVNLEHILPRNPEEGWSHIDAEVAGAYYRRLGNMVLLHAQANSIIGNSSYEEKRPVLAQSSLLLTQAAAEPDEWTPDEIAARQEELADLAVETWPRRV